MASLGLNTHKFANHVDELFIVLVPPCFSHYVSYAIALMTPSIDLTCCHLYGGSNRIKKT